MYIETILAQINLLRVIAHPGNCSFLLGTLALLGEKEHVDVGENTTGSDGGVVEKLSELVVVSDSELDVSGNNSGLLVVLSGVASELKNLSGEVLKDGSKVHGGTGTNSLGVSAVLHVSGDSADGELETSLG